MSALPESSPLESLPLHLFEMICDHLAADTVDKDSISSLSRTCRRLHSATSKPRYRSVQITFANKDELARNVEWWLETLCARDSMRHVRRLTLLEKPTARPMDQWPPSAAQESIFPDAHELWPLNHDDAFWTRPEPVPFEPCKAADKFALEPWKVLVDAVIPRMTGLRDLFYQCQNQVPACLLNVVHAHPGNVRLHVHTFSLRSLCQDPQNIHDVDPHEYQLASSPRLSSIRAVVPSEAAHGIYDQRACFHRDALWEMVTAGLAPSLKSLSLHWGPMRAVSVHGTYHYHRYGGGRPEWPGFFSDRAPAPERRRGALETLALSGNAPPLSNLPSRWSQLTDIGVLRSLQLRTAVDVSAVVDIAEAGGLRSLRDFCLWTAPPQSHFLYPDGKWDDSKTARVLRALRPLESLELRGLFGSETFGEVVRLHGATLESLRLVPTSTKTQTFSYFTPARDDVEALVRGCPGLRDLELLVQRTGGDKAEAGLYRALGRLRHLDRLSLLLNCSDEETDGQARDMNVEDTPGPAGLALESSLWGVPKFCINRLLASDILGALCAGGAPRLVRLVPVRIGRTKKGLDEDAVAMATCLAGAWVRARDARWGREGEFRTVAVRARGADRVDGEAAERLRRRVADAGLRGTCAVFETDLQGLECPRLWGCQ